MFGEFLVEVGVLKSRILPVHRLPRFPRQFTPLGREGRIPCRAARLSLNFSHRPFWGHSPIRAILYAKEPDFWNKGCQVKSTDTGFRRCLLSWRGIGTNRLFALTPWSGFFSSQYADFPLGTALGVFAIVVLNRPSVRALFHGLPATGAKFRRFRERRNISRKANQDMKRRALSDVDKPRWVGTPNATPF